MLFLKQQYQARTSYALTSCTSTSVQAFTQTQIFSDSTFKTYVDNNKRFSIEYPEEWILYDDGFNDTEVIF